MQHWAPEANVGCRCEETSCCQRGSRARSPHGAIEGWAHGLTVWSPLGCWRVGEGAPGAGGDSSSCRQQQGPDWPQQHDRRPARVASRQPAAFEQQQALLPPDGSTDPCGFASQRHWTAAIGCSDIRRAAAQTRLLEATFLTAYLSDPLLINSGNAGRLDSHGRISTANTRGLKEDIGITTIKQVL